MTTAATSSTAAARFALTLTAALLVLLVPARADELFYTGGTWHTGTTTGPTAAGPTATDSAHVIDGGIDIPAGQTFTTILSGNTIFVGKTATVQTGAGGSIGALAGSSGTVSVDGGYWDNRSHFLVGGAGTGVLNINSGTMRVAGSTFIGRALGGSGTVSINNGLMQTTSWVHVGGVAVGESVDLGAANAGDGHLYIAQTGTLVIGSNGMRVAYGNVNSTGTAVVDGVLKSTGYIQIGHWGKGALTIGQTGTVTASTYILIGGGDGASSAYATGTVAGYMSADTNIYVASSRANATLDITTTGTVISRTNSAIGYSANATGTANVAGLWSSTGWFVVGYTGTGVLNLAQTGTIRSVGASYIGNAVTGSGTANIDGTWSTNANFYIGDKGGKGVLNLAQTGTILAGGVGYVGSAITGSGTANIAGVWSITSHLQIGVTGGKGVINILPTGTLQTAVGYIGMSFSGTNEGTAYVTVDGVWESTSYMLIGRQTTGVMIVNEGGKVLAPTSYTNIGDQYSAGAYRGKGYLQLAGEYLCGTSFSVGNAGDGVLDLLPTGTLRIGTEFRVNHTATGSGTANIAGYLSAAAIVLSNGGQPGTTNILGTGTVIASGNYTQRAAATLGITLDPTRTTPYVEVGGIAALGGALNVTGFTGTISGPITKASQIPTDSNLIIHSANGFSGDFSTVNNIGGATGLPSYVSFTGLVYNDTDYRVGYILAGSIDLAAGETFEIDVPLRDVPSSTKWDGKSLIKTGAGTLIYSATTTRHTGVTLIEDGVLQITSPAALTAFRGDLVNNSIIDLTAAADDGPRTLRAARIFGNGTFLMAVNTATHTADQLEITGDPSLLLPATIAGSHQLLLTDTRADGATPTDADIAALTLVRLSDPATAINNATFIANPDWGDGSVVYPVRFAPDGSGTLGDPAPSTTSEAALAITAAQNLMWAGQQDNLARRLGDLRAQPASTGLWARAYASSVTLDPADTGDVRLDLYGLTVGADFSWKVLNGALHAGLYAGYGRSTQDFTSTADGESTLIAGGLYAAWLHDAGWFANATLGYARLQNEFTATDAYGLTTADHNNTALALSLESGRRFASTRGWFAEPSAQFSLTRLDQSDYTTTGAHALPVRATAATIYRARLGALFGRALALTNGSTLQLHARLGGLCEGSTGGETAIGSLTRRPNLDGPRAEAGLGLLWRQSAATQFYFDYDVALGQNYEQPWLLSLGLRHTF